jgi:rare lipoprotein A
MKTTMSALAALLGLALIGLAAAQAPATPAPAAAQPPSPPPAATPAPAPAAPAAKSGDAMEGLAAVYSDKLNGRKTASGQVFSQSALTAAHPTLPFGTRVKVTNTKNDKSVEVRVNDRGPTQAGRVIDLSSAAAAKIGLRKTAMAPVKLEVTGEPAKKSGK